jgi:hypothetical protein
VPVAGSSCKPRISGDSSALLFRGLTLIACVSPWFLPLTGDVEIGNARLYRREDAETLADRGGRASVWSAVLVVQASEGSVHAVRGGRLGERLAGLRCEGLEQVCDQPGRGLGSRSGGGGNHPGVGLEEVLQVGLVRRDLDYFESS